MLGGIQKYVDNIRTFISVYVCLPSKKPGYHSRIHMDITLLLVGALVFVLYTIYLNVGLGNLPPGPLYLPVIGSVWALGITPKKGHLNFNRLALKWGPIYRVKIFSHTMVVITDPDILREALHGINSPILPHVITRTRKKLSKSVSLVFSEERQNWVYLRKLCTAFVRNAPAGTPICQVIQEEQDKLMAELDNLCDTEVYLNPKLMFFVRNIFLRIVLRKSWDFDTLNEEEQSFSNATNTLLENLSGVGELVPMFEYLRLVPTTSQHALDSAQKMDNYIKRIVTERENESPPTDDTARDFLDVLIIEHRNNPDSFSEAAMLATMRDLFIAGTITVSDTLDWLLLFLCDNPSIQEKCYQEINDKLSGRLPTMDDQANLPYLDSAIKETFRMRPPVPLSLPHLADRDCSIAGYRIEKGTTILSNIYGIGNSERFFVNPAVFDPDRWMKENHETNKSNLSQNLLPFGCGPTICLGMPVAKQEVFLTAARLIQRYAFSFNSSAPRPDFTGEYQVTFNPKEWQTRISLRGA